jgi:hypothetical protein
MQRHKITESFKTDSMLTVSHLINFSSNPELSRPTLFSLCKILVRSSRFISKFAVRCLHY